MGLDFSRNRPGRVGRREHRQVLGVRTERFLVAGKLLVLDVMLPTGRTDDRPECRVMAMVHRREEVVLDLIVEATRQERLPPAVAPMVRGS